MEQFFYNMNVEKCLQISEKEDPKKHLKKRSVISSSIE